MDENSNVTDVETHSARRELYEVYTDHTVKPRYKKKLIESLDEIYGYDLAFLVGLIMRSEFSGNLNVISQSDEISGISFSQGRITKIDLNDKETFMGELLIKDGYLTRETLSQLLNDQTKPLGELIISSKIATREQVIAVLVKQMRLRLSKYINNNKYRVNFSETEIPDHGLSISYPDFLNLAHDWVAGRFTGSWLNLHYMELSENLMERPTGDLPNPDIKALPLSKDLESVLAKLPNEKVFSKFSGLFKTEKDQEYFLKSFHYGVMSGQIILRQDAEARPNTDTILKNIYLACSKKTGVEMLETLAHILKLKPTEIDLIFQSINNYVHAYSGQDYDMKNNMFRLVLEMLSKKQHYYDEINKKYAAEDVTNPTSEVALKIKEIYGDLLKKNLYVAVDKLKKINQFAPTVPKIKLYMVWAKTLMIHQNNIKINLDDLDREFLQILPEDKDTAEYFYVKSIFSVLKKNAKDAEIYFEKCIKLNPDLKNYPPSKTVGSFIKNLLKFSFVLCFALGAKAQDFHSPETPMAPPDKKSNPESSEALSSILAVPENVDETTKTNMPGEKKDFVYGEPASPNSAGSSPTSRRLPFTYLNQYFDYRALENDDLMINDTRYSLADMDLMVTGAEVQVNFKDSLLTMAKKPLFYSYSPSTKKANLVKPTIIKEKILLQRNQVGRTSLLCAFQKNQYTTLRVCKSLNPTPEPGYAGFTANSLEIEPEGSIVLNELGKKTLFVAVKRNGDQFQLETTKRNVLPARITKSPNSEVLDIQFVEASNSRYAWEDQINLNQNYFSLKFDELISLRQGIFFSSKITESNGLSETYINRGQVQKKYYNKLIVEPLFVFSELHGKSSTADATIRSQMGIGLSLTYDRHLQSRQNIYVSLSHYTTEINPPNSNTLIQSSKINLSSVEAGYRYGLSARWSISAIARVQEDMFFNQVNSSAVRLTKALNKSLGIGPEFIIYDQNKWNVGAALGAYLLFPTEIENTTRSEMGSGYDASFKAAYKFNWGRISAGINAGIRNQKNDTYDYKESFFVYRAGINHLF